MQKSFKIECVDRTRMYPLGVSFEEDGLRVSAVCGNDCEAGIVLYDRGHREGVRVPFPEDCRVGAVRAMLLSGYHDKSCRYLFYSGEEVWQDPCCKAVESIGRYGMPNPGLARCLPERSSYDWGEDKNVRIPSQDRIIYALHVRGFTKHNSSGVKHKGTYAGVVEKIPYLKELGINMTLLMPAYEFEEVMPENTARTMEQAALDYKKELPAPGGDNKKPPRINYWGYQKGLYYVPKGTYAAGKDAAGEFKDMVRAFHAAGIGVSMQFYFPPELGAVDILDILRYWVLEYHIDGFHLLGVSLPVALIADEPLLADTLLLIGEGEYKREINKPDQLAYLSDSFLYDMRRFLKGDDNLLNRFVYYVRESVQEKGAVNSIARWDGMRLFDLVSYDRKHNEQNGEDNQDGTNYNCSWNCGVEGKSRKKSIQGLRLRQMKNALTFLFISQGTPLLYSGDEFANTQGGNNNPYCQDNDTTWIKWNRTELGTELFAYTKHLINLRKRYRIQYAASPCETDTSSGYPGISFHGREAWRPDTDPASRSLGILYCSAPGDEEKEEKARFFYIGINMHWEVNYLGLPSLPKGKRWIDHIVTGEELPEVEEKGASQEICLPARTIAFYCAEDVPEELEKAARRKQRRK
ncbi:MAG: hypothetical protein K2O59_04915 [Lachnospiraceae bacterium]|nr:hypothetical protein [Lachnospiraceae bacterium]